MLVHLQYSTLSTRNVPGLRSGQDPKLKHYEYNNYPVGSGVMGYGVRTRTSLPHTRTTHYQRTTSALRIFLLYEYIFLLYIFLLYS